MARVCGIRTVDGPSAEVARPDATFIAEGAHAVALVHVLQFAVGLARKTAWDLGGVRRATSVAVMAGGGRRPGATLFAQVVHAPDLCRALVRALALLIHRTLGIAGAELVRGRVAGGKRV